jgi:excisionase family DNA binding protein
MASQPHKGTVVDTAVLRVEEVANYLRLSRKTVYRMARSGKLPAFKASSHWRVQRADLEAWIKRRTVTGEGV